MNIQGLIFDVNGTLIDISTDEGKESIYRAIATFLLYQGVRVDWQALKDEYYKTMSEQRKASAEEHPEFDAVGVWREIVSRRPEVGGLTRRKQDSLPRFLAEMYRALSLDRLQLYPDVWDVLVELRPRFKLAALSDAQSAWALSELRAVGVDSFFKPIVVSGDLGFRKPDGRIFQKALRGLALRPENVLFVGNDMYRDIYGAGRAGLKTVFFASNQGRRQMNGVEPEYIIYRFGELRQAIEFFARKRP